MKMTFVLCALALSALLARGAWSAQAATKQCVSAVINVENLDAYKPQSELDKECASFEAHATFAEKMMNTLSK